MESHFTATGFVVEGERVLLLWHRKAQMWLPPGGHLLPGEDPVAAVLREMREETGLAAEVVRREGVFPFAYPQQLPPPFTILVENSFEEGPPHQHIDFIYFLRPAPSASSGQAQGGSLSPPEAVLAWADEAALRADRPLELRGCGRTVAVPADVRALALAAIDFLRSRGHEQT